MLRSSIWACAAAIGCASSERPAPAPVADSAVVVVDSTTFDTLDAAVDETAMDVELDTAMPDTDVWDGAIVCDAPASDAEPGTRFCDLYRDVFSPIGSAQCQSSGCHGGSTGIKKVAFGWTGDECYAAMIKTRVDWLSPLLLVDAHPGTDSRPTSLLPRIVDPSKDAGLLMPWPKDDAGNRLLNDAERARIDAWLARGAPFD